MNIIKCLSKLLIQQIIIVLILIITIIINLNFVNYTQNIMMIHEESVVDSTVWKCKITNILNKIIFLNNRFLNLENAAYRKNNISVKVNLKNNL